MSVNRQAEICIRKTDKHFEKVCTAAQFNEYSCKYWCR